MNIAFSCTLRYKYFYTLTSRSSNRALYVEGLYILLRPTGKNKRKRKPPKVPEHLKDLVMKEMPPETCPWSLSGPQFPKPTAIQQRYCYPKGHTDYSSIKGAALWTIFRSDGVEDLEFRLLHVYYSNKRAVNKGVEESPKGAKRMKPYRTPPKTPRTKMSPPPSRLQSPPMTALRSAASPPFSSPRHRQNHPPTMGTQAFSPSPPPLSSPHFMRSPALTTSSVSSPNHYFHSPLGFDVFSMSPSPATRNTLPALGGHYYRDYYYHQRQQQHYHPPRPHNFISPMDDTSSFLRARFHPLADTATLTPSPPYRTATFPGCPGRNQSCSNISSYIRSPPPRRGYKGAAALSKRDSSSSEEEARSGVTASDPFPCDMETSLHGEEGNDSVWDDPLMSMLLKPNRGELPQPPVATAAAAGKAKSERSYVSILSNRLEDLRETVITELVLSAPASEQPTLVSAVARWARSVARDPLMMPNITPQRPSHEPAAVAERRDDAAATSNDDVDKATGSAANRSTRAENDKREKSSCSTDSEAKDLLDDEERDAVTSIAAV